MNRLLYISVLVFFISFNLITIGCSKKEPESSEESSEESSQNIRYTYIEWTDLLPDEDLEAIEEAIENPPAYLAEIEDGSESDQLMSQLKAQAPSSNDEPSDGNKTSDASNAIEERYQQALASTNIRPEFNGRNVQIPGFIVPLEFNDQQTITTFFLVPFFGACLHMPPPPPNQIIYAEYEPGIRLDSLYDAFVINGTVFTTLVENDMATAAYSMTVSSIEPYPEDAPEVLEQNIEDDLAM